PSTASLAVGSSLSLAAAIAERGHSQQCPNGGPLSVDTAPAKASQAIPWSQIGPKAGADYKGDGLAVTPAAGGARLHCVFQRLEGHATPEGLWLTSTATEAVNDRFRIVAVAVGRPSSLVGTRSTASPLSQA